MKNFAVVLGLMVASIMGLLGIIHSRTNLVQEMTKSNHLENVKIQVSTDLLKELQGNIAEATGRVDETKKQTEELTDKVKKTQEAADGKKAELNTCNNDLSQIKTEIGSLEAERSKTDTEFQKKKSDLNEQINKLKKEFEIQSKVCDYIQKTSVEGMKLCGIEPAVPQVEQNPGAAKAA
ncbi:repetitive organellar protein [Tachysurus fulvidraco]|uniref:repetitive organellar protein n=1 Tax=Tachysurus fulvidraco TaxID=1234273 RepID=UPI001FEDB481|nr:repetitive organellar protein [Tachysurus fulvidraco]